MLDVRRLFAFTALTFVALAPAAPAPADQGMITYRQSVMKAVGGHTGAMAGIVKGEVPFTGDLKGHARALAELAEIAPRIFPESSGVGDSRALPAIWQKPDEFKKAMTAFQTAAAELNRVAEENPRNVGAALGELGKTCKGCHDSFRKDVK